ncbi:MAG: MG2 domain-containing protein [Vicinamibacterales bacterium]
MRRRPSFPIWCLVLAALAATSASARGPAALTVVSAGPTGELRQLQDASEIRVIFSEPMVPLGRVPDDPSPSWIHLAPAARGSWRWSGTTILIFTPDPDQPLPYATRYTVTVDAAATSAAGQVLGAPFTFTFTTPTVRLTSARWARQGTRFDTPVALALRFNQPVRPADALAHVAVRYAPHAWEEPSITTAERERMAAIDPSGPGRFDAKLAAARQVAALTDVVALRIATTWDRERLGEGPEGPRGPGAQGSGGVSQGQASTLVVLETTMAPPPGAWLQVTVDTAMPSPAGAARPPDPQTSLVELDPVFFAMRPRCRAQCVPSWRNGVLFSGDVNVVEFARALTVADVSDGTPRAIARASAVDPATRDWSTYHGVEDAGYESQPPATTWALALDPALTAVDGQTLGYPWVGLTENWHERAFVSFGDGHGVWERAGGRQLPFHARNFQDITQFLVPLTARELMPRLLDLEQRAFRVMPPGPGTSRRLPVTPDEIQSHGVDLGPVLSPAGTGLAWVGIEPGTPIDRSDPVPHTESTVVQVTNLGLSVKDSPQSTLVFVTRLDNGQAVDGARVSIVNTDNRAVWSGTTGADGVAMAPALPLRDPDNWYRFSFLVMAEKDGDVAYVGSDWNEGISPWDFGTGYQLWEATDILRASVFTDRGLYKPGEAIRVKAIARLDTPQGIRLLADGSTLEVRVHDSRDREVDRRTVPVNRWSSAEWTWTVPETATLGGYRIEVMLPGAESPEGNDATPRVRQADWLKRAWGSFTVAAYRKPDFRVDATLAADPAVAGTTLRGAVEARYLFGSAMSGRPATWSVRRTPAWEIPAPVRDRFPSDRWAFGYSPDSPPSADTRVAGAAATLDAQGRLAIALPTEAGTDLPLRYQFEGDVEDVSRQHIAGRAAVVVQPAPWHVGLRRPPYFAEVADGTRVEVIAADASGAMVPGLDVTLRLTRVQWNSVRRAEGSGFYTWETERLDVPAGQWTVRTGDAPAPLAIPLAEGGYYELTAEATDGTHRTRTDVSFYALGGGYTAWRRYDHNRIAIEPERPSWKPGERARLMIQSPWEQATALLTVEREGVRRYERFTLTSTQQTVEVPITEDDIPNLYVSVLLVRGRTSDELGADGDDPGKPAFRLGYAELQVEDASKRLAVDVTADREEYRPANTARVSVAVADAAGRPARSEVTLWAVDYGVLSLTGYRAPDVLRAIYQHKALQVMNEDSRQRIISRRVLTPKGGDEGGGGGGEGGVRQDFRPLAFWLGSVETDATGRATREVTLPEALTTYRIMAVAGDAASRFGDDDTEIRVSTPLAMLPALPRFLALGDHAALGAVVTNTLAAGGRATVTIESLTPDVLAIEGDREARVVIEGGGTAPARFDAHAVAVGTARVRLRVRLGDHSDALETTFPVVAPGPTEVTAAFGDTDARAVERLRIPAGIVPTTGGLDVRLASTALVGLGEGARYLVDYPFQCAEQKASSALALVLAADLGSAFAMPRIAPADYRAKASTLLASLPDYQCTDGGFGYWTGGCRYGQVYLTSYVLHVMHVARGLGFEPDQAVVGRALDFLDQELRKAEPGQVQWLPAWSAGQAFGVKVLTEYGRNQDSNITRLARMADRLPIFSLSHLADAMAAAPTPDPRYPDVIRRLTNAMRVEGDRAWVQELDEDALAWIWNSNVRATAIVLEGLARRGDDPTFVQRSVRWLLAARRNGRWRNTQENATALEALVTYYKRFEAEPPDFSATVSIGGRDVGTARFQGRSTDTQAVHLAMPDLLRRAAADTEHELAIARAGTGRLYYTARLEVQPTTPPEAADQGIRVERRYERYVENGTSPAATTFDAGDLIRVTLSVTIPVERRYVAVTDSMPAGVEAVDGWFRTTAADLARDASAQSADESWEARWRRGGFDHVEKYDDRVALFATRLGPGRHEFSYLVRATTSGTFTAAGPRAEEMYAPEVFGAAAPATIRVNK